MVKALSVPILFLVFNKPETTAKVFEAIKKAKPERLYVAADGPRKGNPADALNCMRARQIATIVGWKCKVKVLFRNENLGCKKAVSSAIDWFFKNEPEGIILEDDCLPNSDFFRFCEAMLKRYRNDARVMHVSGDNFQDGKKRGSASYYFSRYCHIWGWATWRRAWENYGVEMRSFPKFRFSGFSPLERLYWQRLLKRVHDGKIDTWDYQWFYAVLSSNGLAICPNANLVSNIGFSENALHTTDAGSRSANMPTGKLGKITHPRTIAIDKAADAHTFKTHFFNPKDILARKLARLGRLFR